MDDNTNPIITPPSVPEDNGSVPAQDPAASAFPQDSPVREPVADQPVQPAETPDYAAVPASSDVPVAPETPAPADAGVAPAPADFNPEPQPEQPVVPAEPTESADSTLA